MLFHAGSDKDDTSQKSYCFH